ncbi:MAG TPA: PP2C family protein-serine/threonine phosphatase, partial [Candidatus Fermentibacter sp.]|nr:PP2C family protein-serine/threonine phosphatase [Candidatus Fermentibacter sp.]
DGFVHRLVQRRKLLTFAGLLLDPATHALEWTSAGHPPPMLFGRREAPRELEGIKYPVGYGPRLRPTSETLTLQPGESVLLYTDGLVETANPRQEPFGYERLSDFLREHRDLPPDALLDGLLACRARFAEGQPLEDDLTLLMLRREPVSSATGPAVPEQNPASVGPASA